MPEMWLGPRSVGSQIFVAGGEENTITSVSPGTNGIFDGVDDGGGVEQTTGVWRLVDNGTQSTSFFYGNPGDFPFFDFFAGFDLYPVAGDS